MRHQMVVSMIWQPDYYTGKNYLLRHVANGWSVSPILKVHSGVPFTLGNGSDANLDGNGGVPGQLVGRPLFGHICKWAPRRAAASLGQYNTLVQQYPANAAPTGCEYP